MTGFDKFFVLRVLGSQDIRGSGGLVGVAPGSLCPTTEERQRFAAVQQLPEIVFVDDPELGHVQVFTPSRQRRYAGYPLIGAAWLLHKCGYRVECVVPPAGRMDVEFFAEKIFLWLSEDWLGEFETREFTDISEAIYAGVSSSDAVVNWVGIENPRESVFASFTIPDHPAGQGISASVAAALGSLLGTPLTVCQGNSSVMEVLARGARGLLVGGNVVVERSVHLDSLQID